MIDYFDDEASRLALLTDRQRLEYVIQKGETVDALPVNQRTPETKVEGCQSNAYIDVNNDQTITVKCAADSKVVQGYLAFLSEGLSDLDAATVVNDAEHSVQVFVDKGNLSSTFTPNRSDAFTNAVKAIIKRCHD